MKYTIISAAVASAILCVHSSAWAQSVTIDRDYVAGTLEKTLLINGNKLGADEILIQTDNDARQLIKDLINIVEAEDVEEVFEKHAILMGVAGGGQYWDSQTDKHFQELLNKGPQTKAAKLDSIKKLAKQFQAAPSETLSAPAKIVIGAETVNPLMIGVTGADT